MMRRETVQLAKHLIMDDRQSPSAVTAMQRGKLAAILGHARRACVHYKDSRYRALEDAIAALRNRDGADPVELLAGIPLLSRAAIRSHAGEMRWENGPRRVLIDHTRGSTDERLAYYWDRSRQAWDKAQRIRGHHGLGFTIGDRELHLWPIDPPVDFGGWVRHGLRRLRDLALGELQVDWPGGTKEISGDVAAAFWRNVLRCRPSRLSAFPSALSTMIEADVEGAQACARQTLRTVFLTGEVTHEWQRRLISRTLGARCAESYGVQEAGAIAYECAHGRWHVCSESVFVEFVRGGRAGRRGELAEVVVTGLESFAMPLVRYCTGDVVRVEETECKCGSGRPVMPRVLGRARDFLMTDKGEWIEPARTVEALSPILGEGRFQLRQSDVGSIEISVLNDGKISADRAWRVREALEAMMNERAALSLRPVDALDRTEFGKCRYVRSDRCTRGLAEAT